MTEAPASAGDSESLPGPLPEAVRARVVAVAADHLGSMGIDEVPGPLRPFARFAPSRRARLAATPLAAVLENDAAFRERVADRLRAGMPDLVAALESGVLPAAADPLDVAAAAYLVRPPGWTSVVTEASYAVERQAGEHQSAETAQAVQRLHEQLDATRAQARAEHDRLRRENERLKSEVSDLRRRLRSERDAAGRAQAEVASAHQAAAAAAAVASASVSSAEADVRRLRARLADAEADVASARRAAREGRASDEVRLRLLLDTVVEAAQGLRRELALPPVSSRPADAIEAQVPAVPGPHAVAARALDSDDPALLDQLLALPQAHLVVDGYNVTKTGYGGLTLEEQRSRLVTGLAALAARSGAEVTCVFDGAALDARVQIATPRGVRVLFSPAGQTADEMIRRLVRAEPLGRAVVVVSSDREVADGVQAAGARAVPAAALLRRLERA